MQQDASTPRRARSRAAGPRPKRRPRHAPHPTATLLLDTAVELLETVPVDGLTIALILERSGVSYGSLYHHYADISDLVEQAVVYRYTRRLRESVRAVEKLLDSADAVEFRRRAERLIERSVAADLRQNRLERVEALGALQGRPRLVARMASAQQEITDDQAAALAEFQRRGWLRADLDPFALSAFIQAVTLGQVVDDVAERPLDGALWRAVVIRSFRAVLFPD